MGAVDTYLWGRSLMTGLLGGADPHIPVAACPGWRVHDVVAHVTGISSDFLSGRMPSGDMDAWTAEQVQARRDMTVEQVVAEWDANFPAWEEALAGRLAGGAPRMAADVVSHAYDIATALGKPVTREAPAVDEALATFAAMLTSRLDSAGVGPVGIVTPGATLTAGTAEAAPVATLHADAFGAMRALSGRRTVEEIRSLRWDGDLDAVIGLIPAFACPEASLGE